MDNKPLSDIPGEQPPKHGLYWKDISSQGATVHTETGPPAAVPDDVANIETVFDPGTEPPTLFDPHTPVPPREMRISREGDGRKLPQGYIINERFEICRCLGEGDVGTIYLVHDLHLKDKKALKLMHPALVDNALAEHRFVSEIKTLQRLSHEHIVRVYDFGTADISELAFFTMEYVEGLNLKDLLKKKGGKLPLDKAMAIMNQILDTLAYAHQHCVHRNLKPLNIMVKPTGSIVMLNFGISKDTLSDVADRCRTLGSVHYQAPELRADPAATSPQIDIYAAGAIGYQMLTGQVPLDDAPPPSRLDRTLPRALDSVLMRCLAAAPEDRFASAAEVKAALNRAVRPHPWAPVALAAAAILALLWGLWHSATV